VQAPPARIQASDSSVYHKLLFTLKLDRWAKPCLGWPAPTRSRAEGSYQLRVDPKRSESGPTRNVARESGAHCACVLEYGSAAPLLVLAQIWESSLNSDKKSANLFFL